MAKARYLLDSGLLIRHLRGRPDAVRLLRQLGKRERLGIAAISHLEIHAGMQEHERYATQKLLSRFVTIDMGTRSQGAPAIMSESTAPKARHYQSPMRSLLPRRSNTA